MTDTMFYGVIASSLGITAGVFTWAAIPWMTRLRQYRLPRREWSPEDRVAILAAMAAGAFAFSLTLGWRYMTLAVVAFAAAAYVATRFAYRWATADRKMAEQREILLLFDTIELYMRAGLSMYHAFDAARVLTPHIRGAIGSALMYWPEGTEKALNVLRQKLHTPEADILASLLLQLDQAGIAHFQDIVRREGRRLEQLKDAADRARISNRPLLLVLYRVLPLMACLGMIAGAFFTHAMGVLREAGIM